MGKKNEAAKKPQEEEDTPEGMSEADDGSGTEDDSPPSKKAVKKPSAPKKAKKRSKSAAADSDDETAKKAKKKSKTAAESEDEDANTESENEDSDNEVVTPSKKSKKISIPSKKQKKHARKSKMNDSDQENVQNEDNNVREEDEEESEDESPAEYEVEKIVGDRKQNGKLQYKIHWKGYSKHQDSWEYEQNLDCPDLIEKYMSEKKKSKKNSQPQAVDGEWTVLRIIDMHTLKSGKREFLVRWKGFGAESDTWEPEENLKDTVALDRFLVKLEEAHGATPKELRIKRKKTERLTLMSQANERKASRRNINKQRVNYAED